MKEKTLYRLARIILTILTFILMSLMFLNEDKSWLIIITVYTVITYFISLLGRPLSNLIIKIADKINNKILKVIYYLILPIILLTLCYLLYQLLLFILGHIHSTLGIGLLGLFITLILCMILIIPYLQTIIILILKHLIKTNY